MADGDDNHKRAAKGKDGLGITVDKDMLMGQVAPPAGGLSIPSSPTRSKLLKDLRWVQKNTNFAGKAGSLRRRHKQ